jgi:hypothetical protein
MRMPDVSESPAVEKYGWRRDSLRAFGGQIGLPFLPYLALAFHFPALLLLQHWPAARATLAAPILVQWFIWFIAFMVIFAVRRRL